MSSARFRQGRRLANRDTPGGRYRAARFPYLTQSEFPNPAEYIDAHGRRYCVGTGTKSAKPGVRLTAEQQRQQRIAVLAVERGDGLVRLNVLFPKGQPSAARRFAMGETLDLMPLVAGLGRQQCRVCSRESGQGHNPRTCSILVEGFDRSI